MYMWDPSYQLTSTDHIYITKAAPSLFDDLKLTQKYITLPP